MADAVNEKVRIKNLNALTKLKNLIAGSFFVVDGVSGDCTDNNGDPIIANDSTVKMSAEVLLNIVNDITAPFDPDVQCVVGKTYYDENGKLYECVTAHSGAWNPDHFEETSVENVFAKAKDVSALQTKTDNLDIAQKKEVGDRKAVDVATRIAKANKFFENASEASEVVTGGYYDGSGQWTEVSGYTNNVYEPKDYTSVIYFNSVGGVTYRQISIFNGEPRQSNFVKRLRSADNNLPTSENPLYILPGQSFVISNGLNETSEFTYYTTWNGSLKITDEASEAVFEKCGAGITKIADDEINAGTFDIVTGLTLSRGNRLLTVMPGYYGNYSGGISENSNYTSYIYDVNVETTMYVDPSTASYLSVSVSNKEMTSGVRYRKYYSEENTLPTSENQVTVAAGKRLIITQENTSTANWEVSMPSEKYRASFSSKVPLAQSHINQVLAQVNDDSVFVKYLNEAGSESSTERLEIYISTKVGACRYDFTHNVSIDRNCDVWRVSFAYAVDAYMQSRFALTRGGEWECAIRLENRDDFAGGYTHGDEMLVGDAVFLLDGKSVALSELADGVRCGEFKCVTKTNLYDPDDHETIFGIHGCEHTFTKYGLRLRQSVDWQGTYNITAAYMAMNLPCKTVTSQYYTDKVVYAQTIPNPLTSIMQKAKSVCLFDPTSGVENNFTLGRDYPVDNPWLYMTDNNSTYNKCYFVVNLSDPKEITSGTSWKSESFVDFKIGK